MLLDHLQRKPGNEFGLLLTINPIPKRQNNSKISTCFLRICKFSCVLIQQLILTIHCNEPVYFNHDRLCSLKLQDKINSSSLTLIGQVFSDSHTWNPCKTGRREVITLSCLLTFVIYIAWEPYSHSHLPLPIAYLERQNLITRCHSTWTQLTG